MAPATEEPARLRLAVPATTLEIAAPVRWRIVGMGSASTAPASRASELLIQADELELSADGLQSEARGNVRVTYQQDVLTADRVVVDQKAETVVAEGNVRHVHAGQETRAERLEWHYTTQVGRAFNAETEYRGLIIRGRELSTDPNRARATGASFTTCDRPRPHYRITARAITVIPDERIVASRVGVWLLGTRLFTVPRLRYSLREGEGGQALFPTVGYNSRDGLFLTRRLRLVDRMDYTVLFDGKVALKRGFLGGVEGLQTGGRLRWIAALKLREQAPNQRVRFLDVDRLPEVGILWAPQAGVRSRFLPSQVQDVDRAEEDRVSWLTLGQVTLGYFRQRRQEFRGDVAVKEGDVRLDARLMIAGPTLRLGGLRFADPRVLVRGAVYGAGDSLTLVGFGLERTWKLGRDVSIRLERFSHWRKGDSRFLFDELELRNEWRPHVEIRSGLNTFSWFARYDADGKAIFDQEFGVARVMHCLEPRISFRTRRRQIGLDVRIVALQGR